jgi:hypothetical protein
MHPVDRTEDAPHAVRSPEVWGFITFHLPLQRSSSELQCGKPPPPANLVSNALLTVCIALLPLFNVFQEPEI